MASLSSCRVSESQCVRVASGVKHLPWWLCVAAVLSGVKLQCCVELPVVQAQTTPCSDPRPQAPVLRRQLLHHCGNEGGRGQLLVPSRAAGEQRHLCGVPQPTGQAQCVRWAAGATNSAARHRVTPVCNDTQGRCSCRHVQLHETSKPTTFTEAILLIYSLVWATLIINFKLSLRLWGDLFKNWMIKYLVGIYSISQFLSLNASILVVIIIRIYPG